MCSTVFSICGCEYVHVCETEDENVTALDAGRQTNKMDCAAAAEEHRQKRYVLAVAENIVVFSNIK